MDLTFSRQLDKIMRERGLFPSDVEKLTGIRKQRIREYISGTHHPTDHIIRRIAIGLNVSADILLDIKIGR
ncbi:MAG: helix-turn-helix transcriptional regulator [Ruminococcus sp.]|jgi:transcriptional regulator with XRE-family HTH domain|nr:helix-turn-helix transcriptional regulator [Ruminococcus sp.]